MLDGRETGEQLLTLTQGARRVSDYVLEFQTIAAGSGCNNTTLKSMFRGCLNPKVSTKLADQDEQLALDSLIDLAIQLDHLFRKNSSPIPEERPTNVSMPVEPMQVGQAKQG